MDKNFPRHIPPPLLMNLAPCFGCGKTFRTNKQLSAHTSQCSANKQLTTDVLDKKRKTTKENKRRSKRTCHVTQDIQDDTEMFQDEERGVYDDYMVRSASRNVGGTRLMLFVPE
jgi:hypothetical protein